MLTLAVSVGTVLVHAAHAWAQDAPQIQKIDSGDTAWMLTSSALVLMMTAPGLALFYGGLVRSKNVLNVLAQSFVMIALISVQWVLWGYTLAFGPDIHGVIGSLAHLGLRGVGVEPAPLAPTIPHQLYMAYQMMFAIITPALITGAFAERMKFSAFVVFSLLWATLVYDPLAHMVCAGGTVVHISSGMSALVCALVIGKRLGFASEPMPPHNLPLTVTGAALLWFGWFGFNAGSALAANGLAVSAFVATNTATAAATLSWMLVEWLSRGRSTVLGAASGAVAGLVAITPASGYVTPMASLAIGGVAGVLCYGACNLKSLLGYYDDALDVVGVHGVGGTWGAIATGLFATKMVNSAIGSEGLLVSGSASLLGAQVLATAVTYGLAIVGTLVCLGIAGLVTGGIRVDEDAEFAGLDLSQHSETAYVLGAAAQSYEPMTGTAAHRH
jgi:Amt family ammonium transporter